MHEINLLYFEYHNQVKNFSVRYSVYNKYKKNIKGYLIHKRNKFVDFIIDEVY